jgi:hypothetical protein
MSARDIRSIVGELLSRADLLEEENANLRAEVRRLAKEVGRLEDEFFSAQGEAFVKLESDLPIPPLDLPVPQ